MRRPAVGQIIAVNRGDDDMGKAELGGRLGDALGLIRIERAGQPGFHIAEGAGARAGVPHDHEGRVLLLPAFPDIGAARFFADSVQTVRAHDAMGLAETTGHRRLDAQPGRLGQDRRIGSPGLFRMPWPNRWRVDGIEHDDHVRGLKLA